VQQQAVRFVALQHAQRLQLVCLPRPQNHRPTLPRMPRQLERTVRALDILGQLSSTSRR
jgi:hypothetical protein